MPPTEILQWLGGTRKTGTLEVEHDRVVRRLHFRDGAIRSCGSDYAPTLLGQHLLSRGRIAESELRAALARQEGSGRNLGDILVEAGHVTREDVERFVAEKVDETIYGLFDLADGTFRFEPGTEPPDGFIETDLSVEHVLLRGATREDYTRRMREFIPNDEVVLEKTGAAPPSAVLASPVSQRFLELVDGKNDVRALVWLAPMRALAVVRSLKGLVDAGAVVLKDV